MRYTNNEKRETTLTEGIEPPKQEKISMLGEKETYKYLGILEVDTIKQVEMKEKIQIGHLRRTRELLVAESQSSVHLL